MTNEQSAAQSIATYVRAHHDLHDLPCVKNFLSEYGTQSRTLEDAENRLQRLTKAKSHLGPFESKYLSSAQKLRDAKAALAELYRPVGEKGFAALLAKVIDFQACFEQRMTVHNRIEELRDQYEKLASDPSDGIIQKSKSKAQQLATMGKIKLEELKIGKLDEVIGRTLIEENDEESIRCNATESLLNEVAELRDRIAAAASTYQEADKKRNQVVESLKQSVPQDSIENLKSIESEIKICERQITNSNRALAKLISNLPNELNSSSGQLPQELRDLLVKSEDKKSSSAGKEEEGSFGGMFFLVVLVLLSGFFFKWGLVVLIPFAAYVISNLRTHAAKIGWSLATVGSLLVAITLSAHFAAKHRARVSEQFESAEILWVEGNLEKSTTLYRKLLDELKHLDNDESKIVFGRLIDFELEAGSRDEALSLLTQALELDLNPQVESVESKELVRFESERRDREVAAKQVKIEEAKRQEKLRSGNPTDMFAAVKYDEIISAVTLHNKFSGNEVAANEKFKGKAIFIDGEVAMVESGGLLGSPTIVIDDGVGHHIIMCELSTGAGNSDDLGRIRAGSFIRVWGKCSGKKPSGRVRMTDCEFEIQSE